MKLIYVTGNEQKYASAKKYLEKSGDIVVSQTKVNIPEIQAKTGLEVAKDKANKAYDSIGEPLFINDASWRIPALNGFPGPYMKYINQWFSVEDFINLTEGLSDKEIVLEDVIIFKDENTTKVFTNHIKGQLLCAPAGEDGSPLQLVASFDGGEKSISQCEPHSFIGNEEDLWKEFRDWLESYDK